jgi:hypothetical protein
LLHISAIQAVPIAVKALQKCHCGTKTVITAAAIGRSGNQLWRTIKNPTMSGVIFLQQN